MVLRNQGRVGVELHTLTRQYHSPTTHPPAEKRPRRRWVGPGSYLAPVVSRLRPHEGAEAVTTPGARSLVCAAAGPKPSVLGSLSPWSCCDVVPSASRCRPVGPETDRLDSDPSRFRGEDGGCSVTPCRPAHSPRPQGTRS